MLTLFTIASHLVWQPPCNVTHVPAVGAAGSRPASAKRPAPAPAAAPAPKRQATKQEDEDVMDLLQAGPSLLLPLLWPPLLPFCFGDCC